MQYIEYIQNGANLSGDKSTGWMINFGRYPTANTKIEIKFKHQSSGTDGNSFFGCHHYDNTNNYFRLFAYQDGNYHLDSPDDGQSRISVPVTFNQEVTLQATPAPNVSITNLNTQQTSTETNGTTPDYKYPMALWYGFDGDTGEVVEGTQVYYIKIWESDVLVMDLWPAVDNGVVGFYDKIGGQMYTNTGSDKVFTAGPVLSSIVATPSKTVLANAGETINIAVECENAWTVSQNDNWLTLSSTGDTGSTTITATAPSYTGATARTDILTFTDTVTGDEIEITISQKKYTSGQPVYLGDAEVTELYLGGNAVSEAYLGEDLVFSSGPFVGMRMTPKAMKFVDKVISTGDTFELSVKSSEDWTLTTDADWFTLSPTTGLGTGQKTVVTGTITSIPTAETTNVITCTSANYSASTSTLCKIGYGIPANEIWYATTDQSRITSLNQWRVYDKSNVQMNNSDVDYTTYGKLVFPRDIGYVAGDPYRTTNGWLNLTELGLPEMDPAMCIGANDFGFRYINAAMTAWTRVYGDYEYINDEETMAWGSDGGGNIISRGNSGTLTIPEGVKALGAYCLNYSKWEHIIFPTTFVGYSSYNEGNAGGQHCFENMTSLQTVKYQTLAAPPMYSNCWSFINQSGIVYYPDGGTGYDSYRKPINFTFQTYTLN